MDPLYTSESASRKRLWGQLVDMYGIDGEANRNRRDPVAEGLRAPLSIVLVDQVEEQNHNEPLELCYSPDAYRTWLCCFCGRSMDDHAWSSSTVNGAPVSRWQPQQCTLHLLLDRMAEDFFPDCDVELDLQQSHMNSQIWLKFQVLDELKSVISTTWINMMKEAPKKPSVPAMNISQQLEKLSDWLQTCNSKTAEFEDQVHTDCHKDDDDLRIPAKRVLDLTNAADGVVRLVETVGLEGRYMALSHCWGHPSRHPLMTVRATLNKHMECIPLTDLPQSFLDAIQVCQYLDVRYVWIDCLCIVQDDNVEWLEEAEQMADIYSKSHLTVAASRAQNSQHGFLFDFPADTIHYEVLTEAPWSNEESQFKTSHVSFQVDHQRSSSESTPLNRRAWCLQEWYLPKRLVEFTLSNVRLMCLRSVETRFGRTTDGQTKTRNIVRAWGVKDESFFRTLWESIRQDIFSRNITRASDKLPALAGLAQMLEKTLQGTPNHRYLAGLWSTRISEDLSWTVLEYDATTELIDGIPSWSWASTTTDSDFIYGRPSDTFVELVEARCSGYARPRESTASLILRGYVVSLFLRVDHGYIGYEQRPHISLWLDESRALAASTADIEMKKKAERQQGALASNMMVTDMPFCPASHHETTLGDSSDTGDTRFRSVASVARTSAQHMPCDTCTKAGYVSPVKLLLLTKTDSAYTALVLASVQSTSTKGKERATDQSSQGYMRIGLLEIDCIPGRSSGYMETLDGLKVPVKTFWRTKQAAARQTITLV